MARLFIYFNERLSEGTVGQDSGASIRDGIKCIATQGVCDEVLWPYNIEKFAITPSVEAYTAAAKHLAVAYYSVPIDLMSLKSALAQGYPIVAGIFVYDTFESAPVAHSGIVPLPKINEHCMGGHCIVIVGYSDSTKHLIVRNSWGTAWGDMGYFYLPYDYASKNLMMDAWVISTVKSKERDSRVPF